MEPYNLLLLCSVMDNSLMEGMRSRGAEGLKSFSSWDRIKVPGLHPSMSMSDLVSHIENQISEHRTSNNPNLTSEERESLEILEEISRCLFTDSQQHTLASDEKSIMSRVNSLCCLLQKEPVDLRVKTDHCTDLKMSTSVGPSKVAEESHAAEGESNDASGCKQGMTRKDSVGELLLNLPRIASLPQFLFNYSEDYENRAR